LKKKGFATMAEATGAAAKRGRRKGSRTAADLREDALKGDAHAEALYIEYAKATLGLRAVVVSQGLSLNPEQEEKSEEEEEVLERERIAVIKLRALPTLDPFLAETLRAAKVSAAAAHTVLTRVLGAPGSKEESNWRIPDMSPEGVAQWKEEMAEYRALRAAHKAAREDERRSEKERKAAFKNRAPIRAAKGVELQALEEATKEQEVAEREAVITEAKARGYLDLAIPATVRADFREAFPSLNEVSEGVFRVWPSRVRVVVEWKLARTGCAL
jgi:hypothetical protein